MKDFFSKSDQIRSFFWIWIWSYLLKKSLMENGEKERKEWRTRGDSTAKV